MKPGMVLAVGMAQETQSLAFWVLAVVAVAAALMPTIISTNRNSISTAPV